MFIKNFLYIILFGLSALSLFYNLQYSNFQGDEANVIKTSLLENSHLIKFLGNQVKAPGQYFVVYGLSHISPGVVEELFYRTPFALAALLAVYSFFLLADRVFSETSQRYLAITLFIGSGLIIGLSRIVQYQSFVLLFTSLTAFYFLKYIDEKNKIYWTAFFSSLGLLFHYDILSITIPILIYLSIKKKYNDTILLAGFNAIFGLLAFIPVLFASNISNTLNYLVGKRINSNEQYDSVYYSWKLLSIYHSLIYLLIFITGLIINAFNSASKNIQNLRFKNLSVIEEASAVLSIAFIYLRFVHQTPSKMLFLLSVLAFGLWFLIGLIRHSREKIYLFIFLWFMFSFGFYFLIMTKPLTHIFNVIMPASLYATYGYSKILNRKFQNILAATVLIFSANFNYAAFLNHDPEYPWSYKSYLAGKMNSEVASGKEIDGIFGFPYNRSWERIESDLVRERMFTQIPRYTTNEKSKISEYYLKNFENSNEKPFYYIYIKRPQSLNRNDPPDGQFIKENENYSLYLIK